MRGSYPTASRYMRNAWKCLNPSYISSENTTPASTSSHVKRMSRDRFTGWNDSMRAASRSLARITGWLSARARSISCQRMSRSTDQMARSAARACRAYRERANAIVSAMRHLGERVDGGPTGRTRSVPNEEGEQPAIEPERDACGRGRRAAAKPDAERVAEERLVQVE